MPAALRDLKPQHLAVLAPWTQRIRVGRAEGFTEEHEFAAGNQCVVVGFSCPFPVGENIVLTQDLSG